LFPPPTDLKERTELSLSDLSNIFDNSLLNYFNLFVSADEDELSEKYGFSISEYSESSKIAEF